MNKTTIILLAVCALAACTPNAPSKRYSFSEFQTAYVQYELYSFLKMLE